MSPELRAPQQAPSSSPPLLADRYVIHEPLGHGGMAHVFRAVQRPFDKEVAIKFMRPEHLSSQEITRRFEQEARTIGRLKHPNTVEVYDFGRTSDGLPYIVMEHVEGITLAEHIAQQGALPFDQAIAYAIQIAQSLGEAHYIGVVHRDLKPDNVMLVQRPGTEPFVKVLDFGIAKVLESNLSSTEVGHILGTPYYMAPEQALQQPIDARTDMYSLGCCLYEFLTGRPPFDADTIVEVLMAHQHQPAPHLPDHFSLGLDRLVQSMMSKDPAQRPMDMSSFIAQLLMNATPPTLQELTPAHAALRRSGELLSVSIPSPAVSPTSGMRSTVNMSSLSQLFDPDDGLQDDKVSSAHDDLHFVTPAPTALSSMMDAASLHKHFTQETEPIEDALSSHKTFERVPTPLLNTPPPQSTRPPALPLRQLEEEEEVPPGEEVPQREEEHTPSFTFENEEDLFDAPLAPSALTTRHGAGAPMVFGGVVLLGLAGVILWMFMAQEPREVHVQSEPAGALVELDGVPIGRTPMTLQLASEEPVSLRVSKKGYTTFSLDEAWLSQDSLFAPLERRAIDVTVATPLFEDAVLFANAQRVGVLTDDRVTFTLDWPEESLELTLRHPERADFTRVIPAARITQELELSASENTWRLQDAP